MLERLKKAYATMDLEERMVNGSALFALLGTFLPWLSGEWLGGDAVTFNAFGFYTSFIGLVIFLLLNFVLVISLAPPLGGPRLIRRENTCRIRLFALLQTSILLLATLSVLANVTLEFTRIEIRFGIYVALIGSLVSTLYGFLQYKEEKRKEVESFFKHPEDEAPQIEQKKVPLTPPPPPPPPLEAEEHRIHP